MKEALERYMDCYNGVRLHGSLNYKTPNKFIEEYNQKTIVDRLESTLRSEIYDNYERYLYFLRNQSLLQTRL